MFRIMFAINRCFMPLNIKVTELAHNLEKKWRCSQLPFDLCAVTCFGNITSVYSSIYITTFVLKYFICCSLIFDKTLLTFLPTSLILFFLLFFKTFLQYVSPQIYACVPTSKSSFSNEKSVTAAAKIYNHWLINVGV